MQLDAPLFVTWYQCVVAVAFCVIAGHFREAHPSLHQFPKFTFDMNVARQVLPLSVIFVSMIAFNNLCLKFVGVAFYNVGRSLTTVFNVVLTYFLLGKTTSGQALCTCAVIILGFFVGVDQEKSGGELSMAGIVYGILASLSVALNAVYVGWTLDAVGGDMWRLTAYNNLIALVLFVPVRRPWPAWWRCVPPATGMRSLTYTHAVGGDQVMLLMGEGSAVFMSKEIYSTNFWVLMTIAGFFGGCIPACGVRLGHGRMGLPAADGGRHARAGIAIGLVTMMQIKATSPLTHNISGTAKVRLTLRAREGWRCPAGRSTRGGRGCRRVRKRFWRSRSTTRPSRCCGGSATSWSSAGPWHTPWCVARR